MMASTRMAISIYLRLFHCKHQYCHALFLAVNSIIDFYSSPIIAFIGSTAGFTSLFSTRSSISLTTSGLVCCNRDIVEIFLSYPCLVPTPFASHAFHPVDGYLQSVPYHLFIFLFPLHRMVYLIMFVLINFWTIFVSSFSHFIPNEPVSHKPHRFMIQT